MEIGNAINKYGLLVYELKKLYREILVEFHRELLNIEGLSSNNCRAPSMRNY